MSQHKRRAQWETRSYPNGWTGENSTRCVLSILTRGRLGFFTLNGETVDTLDTRVSQSNNTAFVPLTHSTDWQNLSNDIELRLGHCKQIQSCKQRVSKNPYLCFLYNVRHVELTSSGCPYLNIVPKHPFLLTDKTSSIFPVTRALMDYGSSLPFLWCIVNPLMVADRSEQGRGPTLKLSFECGFRAARPRVVHREWGNALNTLQFCHLSPAFHQKLLFHYRILHSS